MAGLLFPPFYHVFFLTRTSSIRLVMVLSITVASGNILVSTKVKRLAAERIDGPTRASISHTSYRESDGHNEIRRDCDALVHDVVGRLSQAVVESKKDWNEISWPGATQ